MERDQKETIESIMSYPYLDKFVVKVGRQIDRFHVPTVRLYMAHYSEPNKVRRLAKRFLVLNSLLQAQNVEDRIHDWNLKYGNKN